MTASLLTQIRDAMFSRIETAMASQFKSFRKLPVQPVQPDQLPGCAVYIIREQYSPDGDPDSGPPRYMVDGIVSVMALFSAADPAVLDGAADTFVDDVTNLLLTDSSFLDLRDTARGKPFIESVPNISRQYQFPTQGEATYVEVRVQFTFRYRCYFPPKTPNTFEGVNVTVQPPNQAPGVTDDQHPDDFEQRFEVEAAR